MRAYFRIAPRFGVSMPWWLAGLAYVVWASAYLVVMMVCVAVFAAHSMWLGGRWCWARRSRSSTASNSPDAHP